MMVMLAGTIRRVDMCQPAWSTKRMAWAAGATVQSPDDLKTDPADLRRLGADDGLGLRETGFPRAETDGPKSAPGGKVSAETEPPTQEDHPALGAPLIAIAHYRKKEIEYRRRKPGSKRFQRTKNGAISHWSLEDCLDSADCPLDDIVKKNLRFLIGIRHG